MTDYEGISGHEAFRGNLPLMYLVSMSADQRELAEVRLIPLELKQFRLNRASEANAQWLWEVVHREASRLGTGVRLHPDGTMTVPLMNH